MDDLNDINISTRTMIKSNENVKHFEKIRRMKFGTEMCEIIQIGKKTVILPKSEIHNKTINEKSVVKYLGDYFNSKGDNNDLISKRIGSSATAVTDIMAFCSKLSLGNFEIHILLQLYDSIFLGKLLLISQSWSRMTRKHYDEL